MLRPFLFILLSVFFIEILYVQNLVYQGEGTRGKKLATLRAKNSLELKRITDEFELKIYEKSGATIFDRAYNRVDQPIEKMIANLAREAVPEDWEIEVKVEEFSHFILLLYLPQKEHVATVEQIIHHIAPVVKYASPYLKNVAVFNVKRQAYLYFDETAIDLIQKNQAIQGDPLKRIWEQGQAFQSFNAVPIHFETYNGHMIIPVKIIGRDGGVEEKMLFDTGASMTVIPLQTAYTTKQEDLNKVSWETFQTANGNMRSPVTSRKLVIGRLDKDLPVAVFPDDKQKIGLLGVDFLKDMSYIVDSETETIYVWEKNK